MASATLNRAVTVGRGIAAHAVGRATGRNVWSAVTYLVTLRCNLRCRYCDFPRQADHELGTDEARRLLSGLRRSGTFRLGLSGGEPLEREDFGAIARHASDLGFITSVVTNAVNLAERVEDVVHADYVLTTVEGDATAHNWSRGRGMLERTIAGVDALHRQDGAKPKFGVICPIHRRNLHVLEEPLRVAEQYGARAYFQPVQIRDGWKGPDYGDEITWDEARDAFAKILAWKRQGRPIGNSRAYLKLMTEARRPSIREHCPAGRYVVTILPDGRATPCCNVPFEDAVPIEDLDRPSLTHPKLTTPPCSDCTISPYVEYHLLLKPDPTAVWEAIAW